MLCTCMLSFKSPNIYWLQNEQNIFLADLLEGGGMHSARQFRVPEALHYVAVVFQIIDVTFPSITTYSLWSVNA